MKKTQTFFLRESSQIAYGDGFVQVPSEKDLLRAHLLGELVDRYQYPPEFIVVGAYMPVRHNEVEYAEIDIIVHDEAHQPFLFAVVEEPQYYERKENEVMRKLFAVCLLRRMPSEGGRRYFLYYTRWYEGETRKVRRLVVDYSKYQNFSAWHSAGRPTLADIPIKHR